MLSETTGLLTGNGMLSVSWSVLEQHFVPVENARRQQLYAELKRYNEELLHVAGTPFRQWINGSFASAKAQPNDIDIVSFLPWHVVAHNLEVLSKFKQPTSEFLGLDCYLVVAYPPKHERYMLFQADEGYWNDKFRKTRPDRFGVSRTKGFLQVTVGADEQTGN